MQYTIISPTEILKNITITITAAESLVCYKKIEAQNFAKMHTTNGFTDIELAKCATGAYSSKLAAQAEQMLIDDYLTTVIENEGITPLHQPVIQADAVVHGKDFTFSASFEVLPDIPLPINLSALTLKIVDPEPQTPDLTRVADRYLKQLTSLIPVDEIRPPQLGDVVNIDVEGSCDGFPVLGMLYKNFLYRLLPSENEHFTQEIDPLLFTLTKGQSGTVKICCPQDYPVKIFRGKMINLTVTLNDISEEKRPIIDEEIAKSMGFKHLGDFKLHLYQKARTERMRKLDAEAKEELMKTLLAPLEYPIPQCLVARYVKESLQEAAARMEDQHLEREAIISTLQHLKSAVLEDATYKAKQHAFLLTFAHHEHLQIKPEDTEAVIKGIAQTTQQDIDKVRQQLWDSGEIYELQERILVNTSLATLYRKTSKKFLDKNGLPIPEKANSHASASFH